MHTLKDVMELTKLSERTLRRYLNSGMLKGIKVGGSWRFSEENLKSFFNEQDFSKEIARQASEEVKKFIRHEYDETDEARGCAILDFHNINDSTLSEIRRIVMETAKHHKNMKMKLHPEGDYVRVVLIGYLDYITEVTNALNEVRKAS